jgi:hypothetical protein
MSNELTYEQILEMFKETDKKIQESNRILTEKFQETDKKFQESERMLTEKFQETDRFLSEKFQETDRFLSEKFQETDKLISNLGKSVGGLGNSIGNITEGLTYPSIVKELNDKFNIELVTENLAKKKNGQLIELDVFGYSNSIRNEAFIVEIKSTLKPEAIDQIEKIMQRFREFFPEHADKKLYGIISAIKAPEKLIEEVLNRGFYFATVKDGLFEIKTPKDFKPKIF